MQHNQEFNPYAPPSVDVDQGLQQQADDYVLADRGTRLAAVVIDGLLGVAAFLPGLVFLLAMAGLENIDLERIFRRLDEAVLLAGFGVTALMVLAFSIYQMYLISTTGQSLGKRWLGIKIVRTDGTEVGFVNGVILRSWVLSAIANVIPFVGLLVYPVDWLMIFSDDRRCLHDQIASTRVIVAAPRA